MPTHPNRAARASTADILMVAELALYASANCRPHWADLDAMRRGIAYIRRDAQAMMDASKGEKSSRAMESS